MNATSSLEPVCARIARRLAESVGPRRYSMWFGRSAHLDYCDQQRRLEVAVPNRFVADWIGRNFETELRRAACSEVGEGVDLRVQVTPERFDSAGNATGTALVPAPAPMPAHRSPRSELRHNGFPGTRALPGGGALPGALRHRLEEFFVGPSNELAFAAAGRLVEDQDIASVSPLFLHGGCGLGKTHLLQGVCRRMLERNPDARVLYTTGEQFTNEFLAAVRANNVAAFRRKIRSLDLLAIDDVHFLANKQATQQEFLHSLDAIELGGARIALASDCHPKLTKQFSEALVSRCVRGLVVEVRQPDVKTRVRIINAIAQRRGISMIDTVVEVIAARCLGSVREIEGTMTKLQALAALGGRVAAGAAPNSLPIGHSMVHRLFEGAPGSTPGSATPRRAVRFDTILNVVSEQLGIAREQMLASGRQRPVVIARSLAVHLARQMTTMSYPEIAAAMSRTAHSTILTADQRMGRQIVAGETVILPGSLEQVTLRELMERLKHAIVNAA